MRPRVPLPSLRSTLAGGAILLITACATDSVTNPPAGPAANPPAVQPPAPPTTLASSVLAAAGDGQWSPENEPARLAVTVLVVNAQLQALPGKRVAIAVLEGGGSLADSVAITDSRGIAQAPQWSLGSADAAQRLRVRADSVEVTLSAYAFRRPPTSIGERVILVRGDSVFRLDGSSGPAQLVRVFPSYYRIGAISPDDALVSLVDGRDDSVCVSALLSETRRCTPVTGYGNLYAFSWSADQQQLLFHGVQKESCGAQNCYSGPVVTLALSTAAMTVARSGIAGGAAKYPNWSPDGRSVAFTAQGTLYLMDADGSNARSIPLPSSVAVQEARWSPDGQRLALSLWFPDRCPWLCDSGIGVVGVDGGGFRLLLEARTANEEYVGAPIWSPDGARIGFAFDQYVVAESGYRTDVFVVSAAGGAPVQLFPRASVLAWR